ncbi:hypothetical protein [Zoogloea sp.]|uniref:hypothetical protein n=1 Tax=Zoogloea sp. TaxID=49181 RepID=UPI0035B30577
MHFNHAGTTAPAHIPTPALTLICTLSFLEAKLRDSWQLAEQETDQGRAFYLGRVSAFELALDELREACK